MVARWLLQIQALHLCSRQEGRRRAEDQKQSWPSLSPLKELSQEPLPVAFTCVCQNWVPGHPSLQGSLGNQPLQKSWSHRYPEKSTEGNQNFFLKEILWDQGKENLPPPPTHPPPPSHPSRSPQNTELSSLALTLPAEADLGLHIHLQAGWRLGGPG